MQYQPKTHWQAYSKIYMELQGILKSQSNIEN